MLFASMYVENSNTVDGTSIYIYAGSNLVKTIATTLSGYQSLTLLVSYGITANTTVYLKASSSGGRAFISDARDGLYAVRVA